MTTIFEEREHTGDRPWKMGLIRHGHHLEYGVDHGVGLWAPDRLKRAIVQMWNLVACALLGHDLLIQEAPGGPGHCVSCCRDLPVVGGLPILKVWEDDESNDLS